MRSRNFTALALTVAAVGALCAGSVGAQAAKSKHGRKKETVDLAHPSDAPAPNAKGTVEVSYPKHGTEAVIRLRNLAPRSVYNVVDTGTGATLGTITTDKKGRGKLELGKPQKKSHARKAGGVGGGADATDPTMSVDDISGLEVDGSDDGSCVLQADLSGVVGPEQGYFEGDASYGDPLTGTADTSLVSEVDQDYESESFEFTYTPPYDENADTNSYEMPHSLYLDTADGDTLPLGVSSAQGLAGLDFQVTSPDGLTVVLSGVLPDLQDLTADYMGDGTDDGSYDDSGNYDDGSGDFGPGGGFYGDYGGNYDFQGGGCDGGQSSDPSTGDTGTNGKSRKGGASTHSKSGTNHLRSKHARVSAADAPDPSGDFLLMIRDPDTNAFVTVATLSNDDSSSWDGGGDNGNGDTFGWQGFGGGGSWDFGGSGWNTGGWSIWSGISSFFNDLFSLFGGSASGAPPAGNSALKHR